MSKDEVIKFVDYYEVFRREESRWFKKAGGIFTFSGKTIGDIIDDFQKRLPIESYLMDFPTYYVFDNNDKLVHESSLPNYKKPNNQ